MDVAWLTRRQHEAREENPAIAQRLAEMSGFIDDTIDKMRRVSQELRPPELDAIAIGIALETHTRQLAARAGLKVFADINPDVDLTDEHAIGLFRIAQEALTNIVRHAAASAVWISLTELNDHVELRIRDDGRGTASNAFDFGNHGSGLMGMQERAQLMGAQLQILRPDQGGTLIFLRVSLHGSDDPIIQ